MTKLPGPRTSRLRALALGKEQPWPGSPRRDQSGESVMFVSGPEERQEAVCRRMAMKHGGAVGNNRWASGEKGFIVIDPEMPADSIQVIAAGVIQDEEDLAQTVAIGIDHRHPVLIEVRHAV